MIALDSPIESGVAQKKKKQTIAATAEQHWDMVDAHFGLAFKANSMLLELDSNDDVIDVECTVLWFEFNSVVPSPSRLNKFPIKNDPPNKQSSGDIGAIVSSDLT